MNREITDPIEKIVASALIKHEISYECDPKRHDLDFRLLEWDLLIEVKRFYTPRITRQLKDRENVLLIQGLDAAIAFSRLLDRVGE